jgi:chaperonin GroEL
MTSKMLAFDQAAREAMRRGVRRLSHVVKVTLGPNGRALPFEVKREAPNSGGDGVMVAKQLELRDPFESLGAR